MAPLPARKDAALYGKAPTVGVAEAVTVGVTVAEAVSVGVVEGVAVSVVVEDSEVEGVAVSVMVVEGVAVSVVVVEGVAVSVVEGVAVGVVEGVAVSVVVVEGVGEAAALEDEGVGEGETAVQVPHDESLEVQPRPLDGENVACSPEMVTREPLAIEPMAVGHVVPLVPALLVDRAIQVLVVAVATVRADAPEVLPCVMPLLEPNRQPAFALVLAAVGQPVLRKRKVPVVTG